VTGIGNALLDVIMQDHDNVHAELGLAKGGMTLVDLSEAHQIYGAMNSTLEMSGGSAANTIAGIASLGGQTGFIGKVGSDNFGEVFAHDLSSLGATVDLTVAEMNELGTGRCHVFVTDDAERTMATYLGAANQMEPEDITSDLIQYSDIVYIEGYLFDLPPAKDALRQAIATTHDHDGLVALSLSDLFCVERHKADFLELITNDVDILLANEGEILTMFGAKTVEQAFQAIDELGVLGVVTIGSKGAMVSGPRGPLLIPAPKVDRVVDQNGAGDLFAAGFLYGLATGAEPAEAAQLAALCAGEVITHLGARPEADLFELASAAGLL
jgi:sugar/nucleoside kinase (ribokinase family)